MHIYVYTCVYIYMHKWQPETYINKWHVKTVPKKLRDKNLKSTPEFVLGIGPGLKSGLYSQ